MTDPHDDREARGRHAATATPDEAGADGRRPSDDAAVLIVDDEPDLADLYDAWLSESYETEVAYSGTEALERLDEGRHEVVLLDRLLPDVSGDEVLDAVRNRGPSCKVAMVTGVSPDADIVELEIDSYVVKPVDRDELNEVVDRLCTVAECDREVQELCALIEKRAVLEANMTAEELATSDRFAALIDEIATKRDQSRASVDAIDDESVRARVESVSSHEFGRNERDV